MKELVRFLKDKKVNLLIVYEDALDRNMNHLAKQIRIKLTFLDELIKEVEKNDRKIGSGV